MTVRRLALYVSGVCFLVTVALAWGWIGSAELENVLGTIALGLLLLIVSMLP